ncbi:hypothetical protein V8Z80_01510 [Orrella sp. JC864]|uniref:lipopolysaccharide biosynthesis protein n=1 Tax=Orrella sp. JC864 TaxID=3120298 RepID=UPI00300AD8BC
MAPASPPRRPGLLWNAATSIIDQAWLSALNLAVGLVLIRLTAKQDYGTYAQLYAAGLFAATIAEALITNPLTTLASQYTPARRAAMIAHMDRFQGRLSWGIAALFGLGCMLAVHLLQLPQAVALGAAFALYVKTNAMREYRRSILFIDEKARQVLGIDLRYGAAVLAATGLLVWLGWLSVPAIFAALALANVLALWGTARRPAPAAGEAAGALGYAQAVAESWRRGRLGLPGALLAWGINYSYLYVSAAWLGAEAAADLNASRLLLMPISLSVVAWSRVARPVMGAQIAAGDGAALRRLLWASVLGIELLTLAYVLALWAALPWLQHHVLGPRYANVGPLVLVWGAYFAIYAARWVGTALMMGADRYRYMLGVAVTSFLFMLVALLLIPRYGTLGAIMALAAVECLSLALVWLAGIRIVSRTAPP